MNESASKAKTKPADRKKVSSEPRFSIEAFANRVASKAVHDYLKVKRNRARNKVAARSRTANRVK